jgi:hypothetical protein
VRDKDLSSADSSLPDVFCTHDCSAFEQGTIQAFIGQMLGGVRIDSSERVVQKNMSGIRVDSTGQSDTSFLTATGRVSRTIIRLLTGTCLKETPLAPISVMSPSSSTSRSGNLEFSCE